DISGAEGQRVFLSLIGVHGARGAKAAALLHALATTKANTNVDTVPREVWGRVRTLLTERGMTHREFASAMGTQFCGSTLWKDSPRAGEADLIVAKHRNGPTSTVTVAFQGHYSRFTDMSSL